MFKPPEPLFGEQLPFEGDIADDTVLTTDNGVFGMFSVGGVFPDTADEHDLAAWFDQFHNVQKNIQAEDVELLVYKCRGEAEPKAYPSPDHPDAFAQELDETYREHLFANTLYTNPMYLAVMVHAPNIAAQSISRFLSDDADPRSGIRSRHERLNEICDLMQAQLANFGLRRLGYVDRGGILYDEIAEALVLAGTGVARQIGVTTGRKGNAMFSEDVHFRRRHIEIEGAGDTTYAVMYTFKDYPASTAPWMLEPFDVAPYRCTLMQSYRFLSNAAAGSALDRKQNKMLIAGDKANDQREELSQAHNRLLNHEFVLGDHNLGLLVFVDSRKKVPVVSNAAWRDFASCGITAKRISRILQAAYLSIFPGNHHVRPRPSYVNSINFSAFAPLYNWPAGSETAHWPGPEIALFRTLAGTPYRYHWHVGDVGNTLVTGATGSGKTTLVAFLIAMTAGRARVIGLDHKRGWQRLFERLRGDYAVLGKGEPHLAPLKAFHPTPANIEFLIELIRGCIGGVLTEEESRRLALGLRTIMQLPPNQRSLAELRAFFDKSPEGAGTRLEKWCWPDGELGWVVDAPRHTISLTDLSCYDTTALLDNPRARAPALACVLQEIALALDGRPLLIPCDEGWRVLADDTFRAIIEKQLRTIRSKNGAVCFVTQDAHDILNSGIANVLVQQCPSQIHLANPRGTREDYVDGLHLTPGQYEAFHVLQSGQGLFLHVQGTKSVIAQLPMNGPRLSAFLPTLSAPEADLRAIEISELKEAAD